MLNTHLLTYLLSYLLTYLPFEPAAGICTMSVRTWLGLKLGVRGRVMGKGMVRG